MSKKVLLLLSISIACFFLSSCSLNKNSRKGPTAFVELDTIETIASSNQVKYQASSPKVSDIIHTKLEVSFDFEKQYLFGKATILVRPYFYPTSELELDARGMIINEVLLVNATSKTKLNYKYTNDVLKIELDKVYNNTENYKVFIDYISKPNELKASNGSSAIADDKGLYFINPLRTDSLKPQQIWTQGETQSNSVWFPTIDKPNEKMTEEIFITVDKKFVTLSNGELVSSIINADNTKTDHWVMNQPHATYLVMMAISEFAVVTDKWRNREVSYYLDKDYEPYAKNIFGNTPDMLEFFSNKLGVEYPWNKYAQVVVHDYVSGAMENTSATLHGEFLQQTERELLDGDGHDVISHELFHQWFGDLVTCESWSNLPLNESFATYGEYLWNEHKYGRDAADGIFYGSMQGYLSEAKRKKENLIRFYYNDKEDMFDAHSYNKGGQVLHMLRKYVGEDAFFAALKLYLETNKYKSVEIHQLRLAFEETTGEDLNWFFNQWFLAAGHPILDIKYDYNQITKKASIHVKQIQNLETTPLFNLPLVIDIYNAGGKTSYKVLINSKDTIMELESATKPFLINFDAEKQLLCEKSENKTLEDYTYQYNNAPLFVDRLEALEELKRNKETSTQIVFKKALTDVNVNNRLRAIDYFSESKNMDFAAIKNLLIEIINTDKKTIVRGEAIALMSEKCNGIEFEKIYEEALKQKSYYVIQSALRALAKANITKAIEYGTQFTNENNKGLMMAIADVYIIKPQESFNDFFLEKAQKMKGFYQANFLFRYSNYLASISIPNQIKTKGLDLIITCYKTASDDWYKSIFVRAIKNLKESLINQNKDLTKQLEDKKEGFTGIQKLQTEELIRSNKGFLLVLDEKMKAIER
jgi:aminopeptidase N